MRGTKHDCRQCPLLPRSLSLDWVTDTLTDLCTDRQENRLDARSSPRNMSYWLGMLSAANLPYPPDWVETSVEQNSTGGSLGRSSQLGESQYKKFMWHLLCSLLIYTMNIITTTLSLSNITNTTSSSTQLVLYFRIGRQ